MENPVETWHRPEDEKHDDGMEVDIVPELVRIYVVKRKYDECYMFFGK